MGKYRHVTDLRSFAATLNPSPPNLFMPASHFQRRRGLGNRFNEGPELHEPNREMVGGIARSARGPAVIQLEVLRMAVAAAQTKGAKPQDLEGHEGLFMELEIDTKGVPVEYDDAFKAAIVTGEAVWREGWLYIRVDPQVLLN